jgi:O-antigen ligase
LTDHVAVMVAVALPWSTSATGLLVVIWLVAVVSSTDPAALRKILSSPSGYLPVLLVLLALAGTFWSDVSITNKIYALQPYLKLLSIPLLLTQFSRSGRGHRVLVGFLVSCSALLALSFASAIWPPIAWWRLGNPGVPVKDQIAQSAEFVICAFCLLYVSTIEWRARRHAYSAIALASSLLFIANVLFVATSRTELIAIASLLLVFLVRDRGWKMLPLGLLIVVALASVVWVSSSYIRGRVAHGVWEIKQYELLDRPTSIGLRLEWWRKSLGFIEQAPIFGNGTGSIQKLFRDSAQDQTGASGVLIKNPHNQIFAIAIPLGLVGTAILFSMWIAHILLFRDSNLFGWFGLVVVIQNMIGSIFNSHLFDFAEGWTYVWGVGVIGGLVLREKAAAAAAAIGDQPSIVPAFGPEAKPNAFIKA